jgi:hypothetical protein
VDVAGLGSNKMFLVAVGGSIMGQLLVVYFPPLQVPSARGCCCEARAQRVSPLLPRRFLSLSPSTAAHCALCKGSYDVRAAADCFDVQSVFQTEALFFEDWLFIVALTSTVWLVDELRKKLSALSPEAPCVVGERCRAGASLIERASYEPQPFDCVAGVQSQPRATVDCSSRTPTTRPSSCESGRRAPTTPLASQRRTRCSSAE